MSLNAYKSALALLLAALVLGSAVPLSSFGQPDEAQRLQLERDLAEQAGFRTYAYYTYGTMVKAMQDLETQYPDFVEVANAQDKYGLASPGSCTDSGGASTPCKQWFMRITNEKTLNEWTPEVWFSGALHGDERVGPNTVMELARYLLEKYNSNTWLKRLVDTRAIWIVPMTNALGYQNNVRAENGIDPNRDFSYDQQPTLCMQSLTARGVNEFWREHMIQRSVTFHGGTVVIAYEWGSYNHNVQPWESPDDIAQDTFAKYMSKYAGSYGGTYPYGRGDDPSIIYPVNGGMEDWGYAASWENNMTNPPPAVQCNPSQNGGYPAAKTIYNDATHRSANILVETSTSKQPSASTLGTDADVLTPGGSGDGHIPRNIRLSLVVIDGVQPYVNYTIPPPATANPGQVVDFSWQIGGAFKADETQIAWGADPDPANKSTNKTAVKTGLTRWDSVTYSDKVTMPSTPGDYYFTARARVDQNWKQQGAPQPVTQPQEHVTRARIDPTYYKENNGHKVQGRLDWYSSVVKITVSGGAAAPQVVTNAPANNEIDVPTGTPVQIGFSKDMDKPSVETAFAMTPTATGAFSWPGLRNVQWQPAPALQANTRYCFTVAATAKDTAGLTLTGPFNSCFTTAAGNATVAPRVDTTAPTNNDQNVRLDKILEFTFTKDMDPASISAAAAAGQFTIVPPVPCTAQPCPDKWELPTPRKLTYTHPGYNQKFVMNRAYTVTVPATLKDTGGTVMTAPYVLNFKTVAPPTMVSHAPVANAQDVPVNTQVDITFSKPMSDQLVAGAFTINPTPTGKFSWNADFTKITFSPDANLNPATRYTYGLKNEECYAQDGSFFEKDLSGNNFVSEFVTAGTTSPAPKVTANSPLSGAKDVPLASKISVTFDLKMDPVTTEAAFKATPTVQGTAAWDTAGKTLTYTPTSPLADDTTYTITIQQSAQSDAGVSLAADHVFTFGTGKASGGPPDPQPSGDFSTFITSPLGLMMLIGIVAAVAVVAMLVVAKRRKKQVPQQQQQNWYQQDPGQGGGWPPQ